METKIISVEDYYKSIAEQSKPNIYDQWILFAESYALLREKRAVNQAKKEWIEERDSIMKNLNNHCDYVSLTLDGMRPEKAAKECNLL